MPDCRAVVAVAVAALVACSPPKEAPTPRDLESARAELDAWWSKYATAVKAGDVGTLGPMHADSVYLVEPGAPTLRGRMAVESFMSEALKAVQYSEVNIRPDHTEWVGDRILQLGTYNDLATMQGQRQASFGRFAGLFQRDSTGNWQVLRAVIALDSAVSRGTAQ